MTDDRSGGGLDLRGLTGQAGEDPGGTGGSSGGGTVAGAGQPAGGTLDAQRGEAGAPVGEPRATPRPDTLAARTDSEIAAEAAALGPADGSLADMAGLPGGTPGRPTTGGEAVGAGAGRGDLGAGTPGERGDLGGGDPLAPPSR